MSEKPKGSILYRMFKAVVRLILLLVLVGVLAPFGYFYAVRIPTYQFADEVVSRYRTCYEQTAVGTVQRSGLLRMFSVNVLGVKIGDFQGASDQAVDQLFRNMKNKTRDKYYRDFGAYLHNSFMGCIRRHSCQQLTQKGWSCGGGAQWAVFRLAHQGLKNLGLSN